MTSPQEFGRGVTLLVLCTICCVSARTIPLPVEKRTSSHATGKYNAAGNASHAPVIPSHAEKEPHDVVAQALRDVGGRYSMFALLLDNMTSTAIRHGITVFAPTDEALSVFQPLKRREKINQFLLLHISTKELTFSNLLRLKVGSRIPSADPNATLLVTSNAPNAYKVDDATIIDPDLYTDATIAVHGIDSVFNISKVNSDIIGCTGCYIPRYTPSPFPEANHTSAGTAIRTFRKVKGARFVLPWWLWRSVAVMLLLCAY